MAHKPAIPPLYGVSAEFASSEALLAAASAMQGRDLGRLDAYSPVPIPGMAAALGLDTGSVHPIAIGGAIAAFAACMAMCVYATGYAYAFQIGGRPAISWPSYIVPSFSFGLMAAAILVTFAMIVLNRLPRLNHPAFNIPGFLRASQDRFFLAIEARHDRFDPVAIEHALRGLPSPPLAIHRVPL